jgi:hypothetical protein
VEKMCYLLLGKNAYLLERNMGEIFKKPAKIRRAGQRGMEITIPPGSSFEIGEDVIQFYDTFVLVVAKGVKVDEELLRQAIGPSLGKPVSEL